MHLLNKKRQVIYLEETNSTNSYMDAWVKKEHPSEGSSIIADYQTGGRGQQGNSWIAAKGDNLLLSFVVYPKKVIAKEQFIISCIASLAIKKTLSRFASDFSIKWPNDIYWKDKKIAGILIENDLQGNHIENSIIGIGLNINQEVFPADLPNPVSLKQITKKDYDKIEIFHTLMHEFFLLYEEIKQGNMDKIAHEYMQNLYRGDGYYWFEDVHGKFHAKIDKVLPSGHLVLKTFNTDEERIYMFKEVQFANP